MESNTLIGALIHPILIGIWLIAVWTIIRNNIQLSMMQMLTKKDIEMSIFWIVVLSLICIRILMILN